MTFDLKITADAKGIQAALKNISAELNVAVARALNKTAMQARTEASKSVREQGYNLKSGIIKASFKIERATRQRLMVMLRATGRPIALIDYGASQSGSGVRVNVKGGGGVLRHAFIARMWSGHTGVFERVGIARTGGTGKKRGKRGKLLRANLPIKELFGPSIPSVLSNEAIEDAIMDKIKEKFPRILAHEIAFLKMKR